MVQTFKDSIEKIAYDTLEITCYMFPLEDWEREDLEFDESSLGKKRALIEFDGAAEGAMIISPSPELFTAIAENMLGEDAISEEDKDAALCEIGNIICGNTVPIFAENENICYIRPPRLLEKGESADLLLSDKTKESLLIYMDEGVAEISIYYKNSRKDD